MFDIRHNLIIVSFLVVAALASQSVKVIPEGRTGVIFSLKGGVQDKALKEGMHFLLPFIQSLVIFDTRIVTYSFATNDPDGIKISDPIVAKTRDGQIVGIEVSIVTQMQQSKAPEVYQRLRTDYIPVLKAKTGKIIQEVIARHVADALYTEETRKLVTEEAKDYLAQSFAESGFILHDVLLRRIDFSKEYIDAIENKQIALQKAQLAQIRKDIAMKEKEIEIIKGESLAMEVEIKGRSVQANPKVAELEYLETIEKSEKDIPVILGLKGNTFVNLDKIVSPSN
jgi:prohibitin 1